MNKNIKKLFDLVVEYPESEQMEVIDASEYSEEVKQKVKRLLQIDVEDIELTGSIIDSVHIGLEIKAIEAGMKIDSYVLVKQLGHGGQGEVWQAQRDEGDFNHQVAIKFLKPVHNQKELQRFHNERKVLAQLKHNNIAQLIGGGELLNDSKSPRPYMILELVNGLPLLEYCKQKKFKLKQYLKVFLQICDAISYAHSHLVVHRDIKPSNIIVTDDGVVKLLDFGIAKIIQSNSIDTQTVPIMTLAYSSPEQVTGAPISIATDIYILGLLLYEMLTGQRAQAVDTEVPSELIHEITEKIPTSPSQVKVLPKLNRNYKNKHLKGDLDNLIMMAIRKEPNRRYGNVDALADDVKAYLTGQPLLAAGDSSWYKIKKLVLRNPMVSALLLVVMIFLIILPIILINTQQKISQQRDLEIAARKQAQINADKAQQQSNIANSTKDFLINILKSASPLANKGEDISLKDVLAQSERQLDNGLDGQPILKAELLNTLASIYHHLGHSDKAIEYHQKALSIYQKNNDLSGQVFSLGQMTVISIIAGDPEASKVFEKKAEQLSKQLKDPMEMAWHNTRMATWQGRMGQKQQANIKLENTLLMLKNKGVIEHELLGRIYNELAVVSPDNDKAINDIKLALYHAEKQHGKVHPQYFNRLINLAFRLNKNHNSKEAEDTLMLAQEIGAKLYDENHTLMGNLYDELSTFYHDQGRFEEAQKYYLRAIEVNKNISQSDNFNYILAINNYAYLLEDMGHYQQAEQFFRESLSLRKKYFSSNPMRIASSQGNLARLLAKMGSHEESQQLLDEVIPIYQNNKKSTLGLDIIHIANLIGSDTNSDTCQNANNLIRPLLLKVNKLSEKSWKRLYDELWLGQLTQKCRFDKISNNLFLAAKKHAKAIYAKNSSGLQRIDSLVDTALEKNQ